MSFESLVDLYNSSAAFREAVDVDPVSALQGIGYSLQEATDVIESLFDQAPQSGRRGC